MYNYQYLSNTNAQGKTINRLLLNYTTWPDKTPTAWNLRLYTNI